MSLPVFLSAFRREGGHLWLEWISLPPFLSAWARPGLSKRPYSARVSVTPGTFDRIHASWRPPLARVDLTPPVFVRSSLLARYLFQVPGSGATRLVSSSDSEAGGAAEAGCLVEASRGAAVATGPTKATDVCDACGQGLKVQRSWFHPATVSLGSPVQGATQVVQRSWFHPRPGAGCQQRT